jgi:thiol:disulfide interchange protein DsbD
LTIILLSSVPAFSQVFDPVDWSYQKKNIEGNTFVLEFKADIEKGWHMYGRNIKEGGPVPTRIVFEEVNDIRFVDDIKEITKPEIKFDETFEMDLELYDGHALFEQRIEVIGDNPSLKGFVEYMCCDDEQCLPPSDDTFSFFAIGQLKMLEKSVSEGQPKRFSQSEQINTVPVGELASEQTEEKEPDEVIVDDVVDVKDETEKKGIINIFLLSLLAGFAGLLTPCVYPMIPMTISFFMRGKKSKGKTIFEGLFFGFSIVAIYTLIGVLVALTGSNFTSALNSHWIPNLLFFGLFAVFAFSFFGMFELVLPSSWANKMDSRVDRAGMLGPFFMALTTVIVSFSCTGPIVGALLVKAAQGQVLEPIVGMFGFAFIFALPFTFFALSPNLVKSLPKSGGWMNSVKVVLGFIVLAFSLKFLSNIDQAYHLDILSRKVFIAIWIVLYFMTGFYLLGKFKLAHDSDLPYLKVPRLLFAIAFFTFGIYLIPGLFGAPLKSLSSFLPPQSADEWTMTQQSSLPGETGMQNYSSLCSDPDYADKFHLPHGLQGYFTLEEGLECARQQNKPVFLDFKGHFCSNCKKMEADVWSDPRVLELLREEFVIVALYTDDKTKLPEEKWVNSSVDNKTKKTIGKINENYQIENFQTNSIPLYVVLDENGDPVNDLRYGYNTDVDKFISFLEAAIRDYKRN